MVRTARARVAARRFAGGLACALGLACSEPASEPASPAEVPAQAAPAQAARAHVGRAVCASCHAREAERFAGSHHDLAMQSPSPDSVLGDFDDASFTDAGVTTRFSRQGDAYRVETEGPDGQRGSFKVAYVFGVEPLQQLLLALPDGRLQAFQVAWDTRPAEAGGQRWFALQPGERIPPGDVLHWSGPAYTWNRMCADCHSTGLERGFDPQTRRYATRYAEVDVSCEACHGPGSAHVAWAEAGGRGEEPQLVSLGRGGTWRFAEGAAIAHREPPRSEREELEVCAPCHARRSQLAEASVPGRPFLDDHRPVLLDPGLYFADGQIDGEVYVWGSFVQSRMYRAGVTCSDCHDPHALAIPEPDRACATCHRPEVFAAPAHHRHEAGSAGASCVACHMPSRDYMVIDARHDHSFRVPRPDVARRIGAPDACTSCHTDRDADWAAREAQRLWPGGRNERPHPGDVLHAGRERDPEALPGLLALVESAESPGIVRATALRLLAGLGPRELPRVLARAAEDREPLVRLAAAGAAAALPPELRPRAIGALLRDPLRSVRIEAALQLATAPPARFAPDERAALASGLAEYRDVQRANAHTPEAWVNLGSLAAVQGDLAAAEDAYQRAIEIGPWFVPALVNLADLRRAQGRDEEGEALLRSALERAPESAGAHHALGLLLVRTGRLEAAVPELARAARLAPHDARFAQVLALAREELERRRQAAPGPEPPAGGR